MWQAESFPQFSCSSSICSSLCLYDLFISFWICLVLWLHGGLYVGGERCMMWTSERSAWRRLPRCFLRVRDMSSCLWNSKKICSFNQLLWRDKPLSIQMAQWAAEERNGSDRRWRCSESWGSTVLGSGVRELDASHPNPSWGLLHSLSLSHLFP